MAKIPKIRSAHDSETRNIINALIERFNNIGYTYDQAMAMAQDVLDEARQVNAQNTDTNKRLDNIIASSGTSSTEVVDARGNYTVLKDRLDESDSQLAQIATNVKNFGAVGDGSTNDTTPMQEAVDYVSAQGGGVVYFPKGIYIGYLKVPSNVRFLGTGYHSVIKLPPNMSTSTPVIVNSDKVNGNSSITIENLRIDGNRSTISTDATKGQGQPWEGINLVDVDDWTVRNVWIENCENEGLDFDGGNRILVDGLYVKNCGGCAVHPSNGQGDLTNREVILKNIWSNGNAITYQRGAIYLYGSDGLILDGFFSKDDYIGVQISGDNMQVSNVFIKNTVDRGFHISTSSKNINVDKVDIDTTGADGIWVDGSATKRDSRFSNIFVKNADGFGIRIVGTHVMMDKLRTIQSTRSGIGLIGCHNSVLSNSQFFQSGEKGISIYNTNNLKLIGNDALDSTEKGIELINSNNFVINGNTSGNTEGNTTQTHGLTWDGDSSGHVIEGNNFNSNQTAPVAGFLSDVIFKNNQAEGYVPKRGDATILNGGSSVVVNHNVGRIPSNITLTPTNTPPDKVWVGNRTSTNFTIYCSPLADSDKNFMWYAE